ncbi:MAG: hypothetical protein LAO31_15615 [Acidobacteriia bacterium]|nr:hypothetical protein [Terriglobia bacterium]
MNPTIDLLCHTRHPSRVSGTALRALLLVASAIWTAGCGKVGPPLPPEILIPQPVVNLASRQIGSDIRLTWTLPALNLNGTKATTLERIDVYRQIVPPSSLPPGAGEISKQFRGSKIMSIDMVNQDAFTEQGQMVFTDQFPGLNPETLGSSQLWYAVKISNKKKQDAGFSNIAVRQWLSVPPAIPHIDFRAEETQIILSWAPPPSTASPGWSIVGYNVYRGEQSGVIPTAPVNDQPIVKPHYEDLIFQFGKTYYYTVCSVVRNNQFTAESLNSPVSAFKPVDVFPPKTPTGLLVVFADGKMNLLWDASLEPDFAGYNVYRSEEGVTFTKINDSLLKSPTFRDERVQAEKRYYYRVSAVDLTGNESPPSAVVNQIAKGE